MDAFDIDLDRFFARHHAEGLLALQFDSEPVGQQALQAFAFELAEHGRQRRGAMLVVVFDQCVIDGIVDRSTALDIGHGPQRGR